jgi:hypothetical protein
VTARPPFTASRFWKSRVRDLSALDALPPTQQRWHGIGKTYLGVTAQQEAEIKAQFETLSATAAATAVPLHISQF